MSTIPASDIVSVVPSVLAAGGTGLTGVGLMLTSSTRIPVGTVQSFSGGDIALSVQDYFGASSTEAALAGIYAAGFEGASIRPSTLLMAQYNASAVAAYLRGGNISGKTIAQLQALSGSLTAVVDGYSHVISSINLASYGSQSAMAAAIQAAFTDPTESSFTASIGATFTGSQSGTNLTATSVVGLISVGDAVAGSGVAANTVIVSQTSGSTGGNGVYVTNLSGTASSAGLTATSNVLDVTTDSDDLIAVGQTVVGTSVALGTVITAQISGTSGSVGTYKISGSPQSVASEAMTGAATAPLVTYDSVSGAFVITSGITGAPSTAAFATGTLAAPLLLTSATGALLSQGAAAASPAAFMNSIIVQNSNFVNYMTIFDPDNGSGNTVKQAFAAWKNTALGGNRFGYFCWDPDASPAASSDAAGSLGQILKANGDSGTYLVWEGGATVDSGLCAFNLGVAAAINYQQTNGRTTFAFRAQAGLVANVTDETTRSNLQANGYNFYGAYGAANANFIWNQTGQITGPFAWADSFETQVWLNGQFQDALLDSFQNSLSVPFSVAGIASIQAACNDPIQAGLNFRAFGPDNLSSSQVANVNAAAGANVAGSLQSQGYYLQVKLPAASVRSTRGPWPITFWYLDQGAVQSIDLSSVAVQ